MFSLGKIKVGSRIIYKNEPHEILEANHLKMGRGGAKLVCKLKNYLTQAIFDYTFHGEEKIEEAEIYFKSAQYLYSDEEWSYLMTTDTFEQLTAKIEPSNKIFLKEGEKVDLMIWGDQIIGVRIPKKVKLEVVYTEPGFKGDTVSSTLKQAELSTGAKIQVPLFIKTGDTIVVNTETNQYDSRS